MSRIRGCPEAVNQTIRARISCHIEHIPRAIHQGFRRYARQMDLYVLPQPLVLSLMERRMRHLPPPAAAVPRIEQRPNYTTRRQTLRYMRRSASVSVVSSLVAGAKRVKMQYRTTAGRGQARKTKKRPRMKTLELRSDRRNLDKHQLCDCF